LRAGGEENWNGHPKVQTKESQISRTKGGRPREKRKRVLRGGLGQSCALAKKKIPRSNTGNKNPVTKRGNRQGGKREKHCSESHYSFTWPKKKNKHCWARAIWGHGWGRGMKRTTWPGNTPKKDRDSWGPGAQREFKENLTRLNSGR